MKISEMLASGGLISPWPVIVGAEKVSGCKMPTSTFCERKCGINPQCNASNLPLGENLCSFGMSYFRYRIGEETITVYGVRGEKSKTPSHSTIKDALKGRAVTDVEVRQWINGVQSLLNLIADEFLSRQAEMLDPLHDPIRLARKIDQLTANIAMSITRTTHLEDAITKATPDLKSLVKAAGLLDDSFELLSIYFNPASATYGKKSYLSLHGLLRKLVSIFSNNGEMLDNSTESPPVYLSGSLHRNILMYESFKLVPFALITNAIKYTMEGPVRVIITERAATVEVAVESVGPLIDADEIDLIFKKRYRGRWAKGKTAGSGVGLYLADMVAIANGFSIKATSVSKGRIVDSIPLAANRFSFEVELAGAGARARAN